MEEEYFLGTMIQLELLIKSDNLMKGRWGEEVQCRWDQCTEETQTTKAGADFGLSDSQELKQGIKTTSEIYLRS